MLECQMCGDQVGSVSKEGVCLECQEQIKTDGEKIITLQEYGHSLHCSQRMTYGDGECECKKGENLPEKPFGIIIKTGSGVKIEPCYGAKKSNHVDLLLSKYSPDDYEKAKDEIIKMLDDSDFLEKAIKKLLLIELWEVDINEDHSRAIVAKDIIGFAPIDHIEKMFSEED